MKMLTIFAVCTVLGGSAFAQGNISAPVVQRHALPPLSPAQSEGSLQRGVRLGSPLQMINPFAPAEYGSGRDFLAPRSEVVGRQGRRSGPSPLGLRLISFSF
jgi:hypothetical protein